MATARPIPKAVPRVAPTSVPPPQPDAEPLRKSRKKLYIVLTAMVVLLGSAAAAWSVFKPPEKARTAVREVPKPPVFIVVEQFTVNLAPEDAGDQYLQVAMTLQVADETQVDRIKLYMPQVRSRVLMLLSSKKASEIASVEGKKKLSEEVIAQINLPFTPKSEAQTVSNVFFTSFVIQ
jgi:flagellar protein FliL